MVYTRPGTTVVWCIAAIEFVRMALVRFFHVTERGVVGSHCYDPRMGQRARKVLVPLSSGIHRCVDHYGIAYFVVGIVFDYALTNFAYCCSVEVDWSFDGGMHHAVSIQIGRWACT